MARRICQVNPRVANGKSSADFRKPGHTLAEARAEARVKGFRRLVSRLVFNHSVLLASEALLQMFADSQFAPYIRGVLVSDASIELNLNTETNYEHRNVISRR